MARVTVEDCLDNVPNRFALVLIAAKRVRQLSHGSRPLLDDEKDLRKKNKEGVIALREIAEGKISINPETLPTRID